MIGEDDPRINYKLTEFSPDKNDSEKSKTELETENRLAEKNMSPHEGPTKRHKAFLTCFNVDKE